MRTITSALQGVYNAPSGAQSSYVKVEIDQTGAGGWVDLTDLKGFDWVQSVEFGGSLDSPQEDATVVFYLCTPEEVNGFYYNLSPFMASSPLNSGGVLIALTNAIRISTATLPYGTVATASDYDLVFRGQIDAVDVSPNGITVRCRDEGGLLADRYIETIKVYGDNGGSKGVEDVIQDILDDHYNTSPGTPVTLYSKNGTSGTPFAGGDSPGWNILEYEQQRQPILDALRVLADQIGYSLRYRYHEGSGINDFVLVLEEPDRTSTTSLHTFRQEQLLQMNTASMDVQEIINAVRVVYTETGGGPTFTEAEDATSINDYKRRWMEMQIESSSQIDTSTEANALRDAALKDLATPTLPLTITVPYFMPVQLGDLYTINSDGIIFDSIKKLAVVAYRHQLSASGATTTLQLRGKPASHVEGWTAKKATHGTKKSGERNKLVTFGGTGASLLPNGGWGQFSRN